MTRMHDCAAAVGAAQRHVQRPSLLVVAAALELGAGPEIQLHALDIGLEPVGELVLRDVGRPGRRKRHVGQVIDLHLVVQRQRVVALAPVVADARPRSTTSVSTAAAQPRRDTARPGRRRPPARPARGRHSRSSALRRSSQLGPRKSREYASPRAARAELLLEAFQLLQRRQQRPRLQPLPSRHPDQPHYAAALADLGFEPGDGLDRSWCPRASPGAAAAVGIERQSRAARRQRASALNSFKMPSRAIDGLDVPAQRQHVAPMAVLAEPASSASRRRAWSAPLRIRASQLSA